MSQYQKVSGYKVHIFFIKTPNKQEVQQTALNHSSNINFEDFMNL